ARRIKTILEEFYDFSSHKINAGKTNLFFSNRVDEDLNKRIGGILGFQTVTDLNTYLGVPIFHERVTNNTLRFVVDMARSKLHCWDARRLPLVGRVALAQSVLVLVPSYFMQSMIIPIGVYEEIECMVTKFIWGSSSDGKKMALDPQIPGVGSLISQISSHDNLELECNLKDLTTENASWNLDIFHLWVPVETIRRIVSIPPLHPSTVLDKIAWMGTLRALFSFKSAYCKLKGSSWDPKDTNWNISWKFQGPQRVRLFIWLVLKQRLFTNMEWVRRNIAIDESCNLHEWLVQNKESLMMGEMEWMHLKKDFRIATSGGVLQDHSQNYERLLIQIDNVKVTKAIQESSLSSSNTTLISRIHLLLMKF
ncbi:hypothetical protein Gorai_007867, partial [Gossypium raimondii]|nr:hypothetical protein [Gossypium raimondii]